LAQVLSPVLEVRGLRVYRLIASSALARGERGLGSRRCVRGHGGLQGRKGPGSIAGDRAARKSRGCAVRDRGVGSLMLVAVEAQSACWKCALNAIAAPPCGRAAEEEPP